MTEPFLSIVTRCSRRPKKLLRAVRSVRKQTSLDAEQLFLVDHDHRGLKFANEQFYRYRKLVRGEYVWALDDDDLINDETFIDRIKAVATDKSPDVILVQTIHEHTGRIHPEPKIWNLDWEGGERPSFWVGGGYCIVVRRSVWQHHLEAYFEGQGDEWATGGDWHFITSLIRDRDLYFARCKVIAGRQPGRGYGRETEECNDDWFKRLAKKLNLEHLVRNCWRIDHRKVHLPWLTLPHLSIDRPLRILQAAQWDWAGCSYMLAQAINAHSPHIAKAIRWRKDGAFDFPTDVVSPSRKQFRELWEWADVIHIHDSAPVPRDFPEKPTVLTMHGSKYRKSPTKYQRLTSRRGWLLTVATPDLTIIHGAPWIPDTRFGLPKRAPKDDRFTVLHAPSIRANKGTEHVLKAIENLPDVRFRLIEDVSWSECVTIKAQVGRGVLIDQFEWGYGCNAIEAWMYGLPVISNAVGQVETAFQTLFGYYPFYKTAPHNLEVAIRALRDPRIYEQLRSIGVGHLNRYHTPEAVTHIACDLYEQVLETAGEEEKHVRLGPLGADGLTLLRYLGQNYGRTTWTGPVTDQDYEFSAGDRLKYVDNRDVPKMLAMNKHTRPIFEVAED